jgi:hypothetical protein
MTNNLLKRLILSISVLYSVDTSICVDQLNAKPVSQIEVKSQVQIQREIDNKIQVQNLAKINKGEWDALFLDNGINLLILRQMRDDKEKDVILRIGALNMLYKIAAEIK